MSTRRSAAEAQTYLLEEGELAEVVDLRQALIERGIEPPESTPKLVGVDGQHIELPHAVFEALRQVVTAMSQGLGVTIVPQTARLTTQEAADFLGISRPTLVKLLESGQIPHEKPGRHRRVLLSDLLDYQKASAESRRQALKDLATDDMNAGIYRATGGMPPRTR